MARTGEGYQTARQRILIGTNVLPTTVDLVPFRFFGMPMTLATAEGSVVQSIAVLTPAPRSAQSYPLPLAAWFRPQGVN
jgi:hypothetical protein